MGGLVEPVVSGINEFISGVRKDTEGHDVEATLCLFDRNGNDDTVRTKFANVKLENIDNLTAADYKPRGTTPLLDAVAITISNMQKEVAEGDKAMLAIYTDGYENASTD